MPNILITEYCNLRCPYCFAEDRMDSTCVTDKDISIRDFVKYLNWTGKKIYETEKFLKILGGEPTVHPEFEKLIKLAFAKKVENITVFSNGLLLDKYYHLAKYKNLYYVINVNTVKNLGEKKAERLRRNLINYPNPEALSLGTTIYDKDIDLSYIKNIFLNSKIKSARIGIAAPNGKVTDKFEYFMELKPKCWELFVFCIENNIEISLDCNSIPYCCYTEEEINYLEENDALFLTENVCGCVLDMFLDGSTSHCFSTTSFDKVDAYQFKDIKSLRMFYEELYCKMKEVPIDERCKTCKRYNKQCAGGCLAFYPEEYKKLYDKYKEELLKND